MSLHRPITRSLRFSAALWLGTVAIATADVKLSALFSDHAVLQRAVPLPVWGWADPGEEVVVQLAGQTAKTTSGPDGRWRVQLAPLAPGDPMTMTVTGHNSLTISDLLAGEVWLASGQSNMTMQVRVSKDGERETAAAGDAGLRCFNVPRTGSLVPQEEVSGTWEMAVPEKVGDWPAVAYYFARLLREKVKVPVGIVHASYGGTPAEAWMSREALGADPELRAFAQQQIAALERAADDRETFTDRVEAWRKQHQALDAGNLGAEKGWAKPEFDDRDWKTVTVPTGLGQQGFQGGGVVWFRKTLLFPTEAGERDFTIDTDWQSEALTVYFNGTELHATSPSVPLSGLQHRWLVPKSLIRAGAANTVAIRQMALTASGYFNQRTAGMGFPVAEPKQLDNEWKFQEEQRFPKLSAGEAAAKPRFPTQVPRLTSTALFNAMINPLVPFPIKGVIWYQGENNTSEAVDYRKLLTALIGDWRGRWGEGAFPFYIVQLANYGQRAAEPAWTGQSKVREAQLKVSQTVPETGLAVAIDLGEETIHPMNKQEVGHRLALLALDHLYHQPQEYSGPLYTGMEQEPGRVRLHFSHAAALTAKGGPLRQFAVAGTDRKFVPAEARIDGDSVLVSSPSIPEPVAVRYAGGSNPEGCNLYNAAGLPASPFRTDEW